MIYTGDPIQDQNHIAQYINEYTKTLQVSDVQIDTKALREACFGMIAKFPHADGIDKASAFKKMGNFIAHFIFQSPIRSSFPTLVIAGAPEYNPNAVVAFEIALYCLENSKIVQSNGEIKALSKPIYISDHSYGDIIDALSSEDISPKHHYKLITVLLEQIVYKTNGHCEYKPTNPTGSSPGLYTEPYPASSGDDMIGV